MSKVKVASFGMSIDGFSAGPRQSLDDPLGVGGASLMQWFFPTRTFQQMHGEGGGETGVDDDFAARGFANVGAWILGRNMFGPVRGPWPDVVVEGLVGRRAAVPRAGLRAHAPRAKSYRDAGRDDFPLHHEWNPCRPGSGEEGCGRLRRASRRRCGHRPPILAGRTSGRGSPRASSRIAGAGRGVAVRHGSDGTWLQVHRARCLAPSDARHPVEIEWRARPREGPVSGRPWAVPIDSFGS